jgi:hypothetical protein
MLGNPETALWELGTALFMTLFLGGPAFLI